MHSKHLYGLRFRMRNGPVLGTPCVPRACIFILTRQVLDELMSYSHGELSGFRTKSKFILSLLYCCIFVVRLFSQLCRCTFVVRLFCLLSGITFNSHFKIRESHKNQNLHPNCNCGKISCVQMGCLGIVLTAFL